MREPIHLNLPEGIDFPEAERAARKAAQSVGSDITLVSFYDRALNKMAPESSALCAGDKGYKVYAESRGADIRVIVNDGQYDFYFLDFQAG